MPSTHSNGSYSGGFNFSGAVDEIVHESIQIKANKENLFMLCKHFATSEILQF